MVCTQVSKTFSNRYPHTTEEYIAITNWTGKFLIMYHWMGMRYAIDLEELRRG